MSKVHCKDFAFISCDSFTSLTHEFVFLQVFLVTGGYAGVGYELSKILYAHNATVWIAGRSESKARKAIASIKEASPGSNGQIRFLYLDLADLSTIKPSVESFTSREQRLHVLVKNAGLMYPSQGSTDAQGNELQLGTNCLGPYLLYQLLLPLLMKTAASTTTATVRVAWAAPISVHLDAPKPHGMHLTDDGRPEDLGVQSNYSQSKVGNVFLARECAKTTSQTSILHVAFNPGNLRTELRDSTVFPSNSSM
ncbi:hypothetical protein F5Y15DRAFT_417717 [Xylariaceae sp. FL0016]|nr:hypothetical protein F5Y15DRAFT_417717 [Xylariaceae sp. FL0016]